MEETTTETGRPAQMLVTLAVSRVGKLKSCDVLDRQKRYDVKSRGLIHSQTIWRVRRGKLNYPDAKKQCHMTS